MCGGVTMRREAISLFWWEILGIATVGRALLRKDTSPLTRLRERL